MTIQTTVASCSTTFHGEPCVEGYTSARLLATDLELSFWGGVDQATGEVIDRFHPLSGQLLGNTILAIPGSRGSCGGSIVMMELMLNGLGPKALLFERPEEIVTFGVLVAEAMFGLNVPVIILSPEDFRAILTLNGSLLHVCGNRISTQPFSEVQHDFISSTKSRQRSCRVSDHDKEMLSGVYGEAARISMQIVLRMAEMMGAKELMSISQAHVDPAWYGPGSLAFGGSSSIMNVPQIAMRLGSGSLI